MYTYVDLYISIYIYGLTSIDVLLRENRIILSDHRAVREPMEPLSVRCFMEGN